jgi:hypothetical protein
MLVQGPHGIFREVRSDGLETNALGTVWQGFANFIGSNLPMAAIVSGIFEQISVELEHDAVGERNVGLILMDGIEHVSEDGAHPSGHERDVRDELFASIRVQSVSDSCRHLKVFRACEALQLFGVFRVAGEEEDLVVFGEGSDGLDGGAAAGGEEVAKDRGLGCFSGFGGHG